MPAFPRRGRDDLRVVRVNASTQQQLSGLLSPPSGFRPVRVNASTRQQLSGLLSPPSGFCPVRLNASTRSHCSRFQTYSLCASLFSFALI